MKYKSNWQCWHCKKHKYVTVGFSDVSGWISILLKRWCNKDNYNCLGCWRVSGKHIEALANLLDKVNIRPKYD